MNVVNRSLGAILFGLVVSSGVNAATEQSESTSASLKISPGDSVTVTRDNVTSAGVDGQALEAGDLVVFTAGYKSYVVFNPCDDDFLLNENEVYTVPETNPCAAMWSSGGGVSPVLLILGATAGAALIIANNEDDNNTSSP